MLCACALRACSWRREQAAARVPALAGRRIRQVRFLVCSLLAMRFELTPVLMTRQRRRTEELYLHMVMWMVRMESELVAVDSVRPRFSFGLRRVLLTAGVRAGRAILAASSTRARS